MAPLICKRHASDSVGKNGREWQRMGRYLADELRIFDVVGEELLDELAFTVLDDGRDGGLVRGGLLDLILLLLLALSIGALSMGGDHLAGMLMTRWRRRRGGGLTRYVPALLRIRRARGDDGPRRRLWAQTSIPIPNSGHLDVGWLLHQDEIVVVAGAGGRNLLGWRRQSPVVGGATDGGDDLVRLPILALNRAYGSAATSPAREEFDDNLHSES